MGQASRTLLVHAVDDRDAPDGIRFQLSGFGVTDDEVKCSKDECRPKMKKSEQHKVVFELANLSSRDLRFPSDATDAIWVGHDDQLCPDTPRHNPEIKPQKVSEDGERLTVHNANSREARFKFSLVLHDENGRRYIYDPIWANRNGGVDGA